MAVSSDQSDPKIILIGLNKTATRSFHELFLGCGIQSVHWRQEYEHHVAPAIVSNISLMRPPLDGFGNARAFSDLTFVSKRFIIEGALFFREMHAAYRDAYFILNSRPVEDWLQSRVAHANGTMLGRTRAASGLSTDEIIDSWRQLHISHHQNVRAHFAGHERFLDFRIDRDDPQAFAEFLSPDFSIDLTHWGHHNARIQVTETNA